ncbi:uncharacterized protein LOC124953543 [Vespa velutina]|uniref:uncharacterized protein LOC124953543 n=1 Tax=Vespa velutina TaxID=202808 RepID=UPI001FB1DF24|nr:uncharacterized protein LOC124953543 [Vespa velutina]
MSLRGLTYFDQHFLLSNRLLQFLIRIRPEQNTNDQFFLFCAVTVYVSPMILHQFYQLFMSDFNLQSTIRVLETMIPGLFVVYCYFSVYFDLLTVKLLYVHFKLDYEVLSDEEELNIMKKYTSRSKLYVYLIVVLIVLYVISITFPSIINVFLYIFGTSDDINLTLPFPVNNVLNAGLIYYSLLIYQIIALFIIGIIGSACYSLYWVLIQHVCGQFSVIMWKIHRPFKNDKKHIENDWCNTTSLEEWNWIIDIIKCYTRITEYTIMQYTFTYVIKNNMVNT